jgi:hypothetical protein
MPGWRCTRPRAAGCRSIPPTTVPSTSGTWRWATAATTRTFPPTRGIFRGNAKEALTAEVYTRPSAQKDVSTLREEIESIDLPVFQEIPERTRDWTVAVSDAHIAQQQEQQQQ